MQQKLRVLGARRFKGEVEGTNYDFTKLRIELPVSRKADNETGTSMVEASYGKSDAYDALLEQFKFPCECVVDVEMTSKGMDVFGIEPVKATEVPRPVAAQQKAA